MDSLTKVGCAPRMLELVFRDPMLCSSIAADGSDFKLVGSPGITIAGASGVCSATGTTNTIQLLFSAPAQLSGNYQLILQQGTDGNTILNECGSATPAGSNLSFTTADTVSALFKSTIRFGCGADKVDYTHDGRNNVSSWKWSFDNSINSRVKDTTVTYRVFRAKAGNVSGKQRHLQRYGECYYCIRS
jgi:hypothetical protein